MFKKEKVWQIALNFTSNRNTDNFMYYLRKNLDMLIAEKDITYSNLAEAAGISVSTLNTLMNSNSKDCNMSTIIKLARALNVTIDELVGAGTMSDGTRECVSKCRVMPWHFVNLSRSYIRHVYNLWVNSGKRNNTRLVMTPECKRGHLQTTNITIPIDISHIPQTAIGRVAHGLMIPCEHYEPYFMKGEVILLAVDRDGLDGEICVVSMNAEYYIVRKKSFIENGVKRWKYVSLFTEVEFLKEDIEEKLGYVVGWLNADDERTWGIR